MNSLLHSAPLVIGFLVVAAVMGVIHRRLSSSGSFIAILFIQT
ncbi:MAG: hypothetical protein ACYDHC_07755 [Desulfuromonadaceae bacterium]